jgi:hypothetical protein
MAQSLRSTNPPEIHLATDASAKPSPPAKGPEVFGQATIGVFCDGNPDVRHDGVTLTALTGGGPDAVRAQEYLFSKFDRHNCESPPKRPDFPS